MKNYNKCDNERKMVNFIKEYFPNRDFRILEVGCGHIWLLSSMLYSEGYKNITAMDPESLTGLSFCTPENIKIIPEYFDDNTNITDIDVVIAIHPCKSCELIINQTKLYNKSCVIMPCEISMNRQFLTREQWIEGLLELDKTIKIANVEHYDSGYREWYNELIYRKVLNSSHY